MAGLRLPPAAQLLDYRVETGSTGPARVTIGYLADSEITPDAQALIAGDARARLSDAALAVAFERLPTSFGPIGFGRNDSTLNAASRSLLAQAAQFLQARPACSVEISAQREAKESEELAQARANAVLEYFVTQAELTRERFSLKPDAAAGRGVLIKLLAANKPQQ
jgi:outer membrane protein OmpA-like peptidoglycan-associated protein